MFVRLGKEADMKNRQVSYVRLACIKTITGLGFKGYIKAIEELVDYQK
jgi:3-dehydroquinate dehydratase